MASVWESARAVASEEARQSGVPGYHNGPGDAIRHVVGTAELRRRAGISVAWLIANANEWQGQVRGHRPALTEMDNANNAIGLAIGARAQTYAEVVAMVREAFRHGTEAGGSGAGGSPVWRPAAEWRTLDGIPEVPPSGPLFWQDHEPGGGTYSFGGREHGFLRGLTPRKSEKRRLEDLAAVPPEAWSDDDVRAVIRSRPYQDGSDPARTVWQERVRRYFEAAHARETQHKERGNADTDATRTSEASCGGVADVAAYTRQGKNGPVQVAAHQRSVPCD